MNEVPKPQNSNDRKYTRRQVIEYAVFFIAGGVARSLFNNSEPSAPAQVNAAPTDALLQATPSLDAPTNTAPISSELAITVNGTKLELSQIVANVTVNPELFLVHANKFNILTNEHLELAREGNFPLIFPIFQYCDYALGKQLFDDKGNLDKKLLNELKALFDKHDVKMFLFIDGLPNKNNPKYWASGGKWTKYAEALSEVIQELGESVIGIELGSEVHENEDSVFLLTDTKLKRKEKETELETKQREDKIYIQYISWVKECAKQIKKHTPEMPLWGPAYSWADLSEAGRMVQVSQELPNSLTGLTVDAYGDSPDIYVGEDPKSKSVIGRIIDRVRQPRKLYGGTLKKLASDRAFSNPNKSLPGYDVGIGGYGIAQDDRNEFFNSLIYKKGPHTVHIAEAIISAIGVRMENPKRRVMLAYYSFADDGILGMVTRKGKANNTYRVQSMLGQMKDEIVQSIVQGEELSVVCTTNGDNKTPRRIAFSNASFGDQQIEIQLGSDSATATLTILEGESQSITKINPQSGLYNITFTMNELTVASVAFE
ncbi:MAG: hypothetical protein M3P33_03840 [bacterium]|nr:hypothetical protein [bacterium]